MKIQIEVLKKIPYLDSNMGFFYHIDESQTQIFSIGDTTTQINDAKAKLIELKESLPRGYKIRILEYHNDDPDNIRSKCKILYEY